MRQYLTATIQALSQSELDEVVEPFTLGQLKKEYPDPTIRVYSIGHEGQVNLHLPGIGKKTFTWIQAAVRAIADKLRIGTAVFDRHNPHTNDHEGRTQIGQVIGTSVRKIGERLNTLAAIHIFPQFKSRPLDVASIEAEIEFDHDGVQAWPTNIVNVSGIALSNSNTDNPGFPGATLIGAVQAYVQAFGDDFGGNKMNLSDVKAAAKELGLKPSQVFDIGDIMGDSAVDTKVKEVTREHFAMAKRVGEERDTLRDKVVTLENRNAETDKKLQQHEMLSKSATVFDAVLANPDRKLDAKAKEFVMRNVRTFTTTAADEDALKVDVGKFVDKQVVEYAEQAKFFGADVGNIQNTDPNALKLPANVLVGGQKRPDTSGQQPHQKPITRETIIQSEMDPDANALIPGGKAAQEALKT